LGKVLHSGDPDVIVLPDMTCCTGGIPSHRVEFAVCAFVWPSELGEPCSDRENPRLSDMSGKISSLRIASSNIWLASSLVSALVFCAWGREFDPRLDQLFKCAN